MEEEQEVRSFLPPVIINIGEESVGLPDDEVGLIHHILLYIRYSVCVGV